jgi:hypothetical protein
LIGVLPEFRLGYLPLDLVQLFLAGCGVKENSAGRGLFPSGRQTRVAVLQSLS